MEKIHYMICVLSFKKEKIRKGRKRITKDQFTFVQLLMMMMMKVIFGEEGEEEDKKIPEECRLVLVSVCEGLWGCII